VAVSVLLKQVPDSDRLSEFTQSVAAELGGALEAQPDSDVQRYIDTHYNSPLASLWRPTR
jgi:hypothetical protein